MSILQWLGHYSVVPMTLVFVLIVAATYWPSRKRKVEEQGKIPFKDDV
ncbi:cbb3-type cytochrome c oxidase subunit 3 [Rhodopila globiformis]|uniref:CcoQ/FixQ family Cbb3-type cytochrome c oxidase assembly chaperone n=1 Tax=Rhodopila globiformis TaxID=1071 RepID=A0A2S6MY78_RHOGL|nr:cbb3-type cytochrome c oxidase subunit 3 [Rhodopila globiformis]PPQ27311.1 hypothetical protein CCS01_27575 [Rhodopila globiformis]